MWRGGGGSQTKSPSVGGVLVNSCNWGDLYLELFQELNIPVVIINQYEPSLMQEVFDIY